MPTPIDTRRTVCDPSRIPSMLRERRQWVVWRYELDANGRLTKVPYRARDPRRKARSTDPQTWATFEEALAAYDRDQTLAGIGFVVTVDCGIVAVDLDHVRNAGGDLEVWAQRIVGMLPTYWEWSPSGEGLRAFVHGALPDGRRKRGNVEAYVFGRFLTLTGNRLPDAEGDVHTCPRLDEFHAEFLGGGEASHDRQRRGDTRAVDLKCSVPPAPLTDARRSAARALFAKAHPRVQRMLRGDWRPLASQSEADFAACCGLVESGGDADSIDAVIRMSALFRAKWDAARAGSTYGADTIARALHRVHSLTSAPTPALRPNRIRPATMRLQFKRLGR